MLQPCDVGFIEASKPLKPFQGLKRILTQKIDRYGYPCGFKASKTLSGIETWVVGVFRLSPMPDASKPLKPFQGLKLRTWQTTVLAKPSFKASKTLSGIETLTLHCHQISHHRLQSL